MISADIFQRNMLERCLDWPNKVLKMTNKKLLIKFVLQSF